MKRCLIVFVLTLVTFTAFQTAEASPFLTCDCSPSVDKVTSFQLKFGTNSWIDTAAVLTCGTINPVICTGDQRTFCYDLSPLPNGPFTVIGRAIGPGGTSNDSLPFSDTKVGVPSSPSLLRKVQ